MQHTGSMSPAEPVYYYPMLIVNYGSVCTALHRGKQKVWSIAVAAKMNNIIHIRHVQCACTGNELVRIRKLIRSDMT